MSRLRLCIDSAKWLLLWLLAVLILGGIVCVGTTWLVVKSSESWYSYHVSLPRGGELVYSIHTGVDPEVYVIWRTTEGIARSYYLFEIPRGSYDVEFRLTEDGQKLLIVGHLESGRHYVHGRGGDPVISAALDFRTAKLYDGEGVVHHPLNEGKKYSDRVEPLPDWVDSHSGQPIARWLVLCEGSRYEKWTSSVFVHWSSRFTTTVLRPKQLVTGEQYGMVVESSNPVYRDAEVVELLGPPDCPGCRLLFVDRPYSDPNKRRVRAASDFKQRKFFDDRGYVWQYGMNASQRITQSDKPLDSYPDWADPVGAPPFARPHRTEDTLP